MHFQVQTYKNKSWNSVKPLAEGHWRICRPRTTLCRHWPPGCRPGDIMFGPWAAYSPVVRGQGCDIDIITLEFRVYY